MWCGGRGNGSRRYRRGIVECRCPGLFFSRFSHRCPVASTIMVKPVSKGWSLNNPLVALEVILMYLLNRPALSHDVIPVSLLFTFFIMQISFKNLNYKLSFLIIVHTKDTVDIRHSIAHAFFFSSITPSHFTFNRLPWIFSYRSFLRRNII